MNKNIFFHFFFFITFFSLIQAQETYNVEREETLYSVSKKFGVSISDLVKANPNTSRGLREGMNIVIPILHESIDTVAYIMHKVKPLESFYSIKNKYNVGEEDLLIFNPDLIHGFRPGTFIKVPQFDEIDVTEEVVISYTAEMKMIENLKNKKFEKKNEYNIAFMLPLYLDKNDAIDSLNKNKEDVGVYKKSNYGLDFYSGAKIAIDYFHNSGMNLNIYVYDTKNDIEKTFDLSTQKELNKMDLVIGPFYSKNFKIAAEILSRRGIPTIAPLSTKSDLLENIPNSFQIIPSLKRQITYLSDFIAENFSKQHITLIRRDNLNKYSKKLENGKIDSLVYLKEKKKILNEKKYADWMLSSIEIDSLIAFKEIIVSGNVIDSIHHEFDSLAEKNIILIPSNEKDFVTDLLTKINATRDSNFVVFGMPEWYNFKDLDLNYLMDLNVHIPNVGLISYEDSITNEFVKKYQEINSEDPSQRFSFSGFDITYYFLSILFDQGVISSNMYLKPNQMLNLSFDFNYNRNNNNGSRNQFVQIIKYEDLEIIQVD